MADTASLSATAAWHPNRRLTLHQARARSRLVHILRFLFTGLAAASLASVFVYTTIYSYSGGFARTEPGPSSEQVTMVQPRFTGRLNGDVLFQLTASDAQRASEVSGPISLNGPIYRERGGRVMVAPSGVYEPTDGIIRLSGGVTFTDLSGNRFTSSDALIDTRTRTLTGSAQIIGEGPLGVIRADAYEVRDSDGSITFRGRVRGVLPAQGQALAPSPDDAAADDTAADGAAADGAAADGAGAP